MEKKKIIIVTVIATVVGYLAGMLSGALLCKPKVEAPVVIEKPAEVAAPAVVK